MPTQVFGISSVTLGYGKGATITETLPPAPFSSPVHSNTAAYSHDQHRNSIFQSSYYSAGGNGEKAGHGHSLVPNSNNGHASMGASHLRSIKESGSRASLSPVGSSMRNIERVLEDAQYTGDMNLSGRNMKEFAYPTPGKYNLIDTRTADVSRNRFGDLPGAFCDFVFLEEFDMRENLLRSLPDQFSRLKCLAVLDLSRNSLSSLPSVLCGLPVLEILLVSHNRLASLPDDIGRMNRLMELDASCNQLTQLPWQLTCLPKLRSLHLRKNKLLYLPNEFAKLPLVHLDLSENKLNQLPASLRLIKSLQVLKVHDNPLESPPVQLCTRGQIHIFKCLERSLNGAGKVNGAVNAASCLQRQKPVENGNGYAVPSVHHKPVERSDTVKDISPSSVSSSPLHKPSKVSWARGQPLPEKQDVPPSALLAPVVPISQISVTFPPQRLPTVSVGVTNLPAKTPTESRSDSVESPTVSLELPSTSATEENSSSNSERVTDPGDTSPDGAKNRTAIPSVSSSNSSTSGPATPEGLPQPADGGRLPNENGRGDQPAKSRSGGLPVPASILSTHGKENGVSSKKHAAPVASQIPRKISPTQAAAGRVPTGSLKNANSRPGSASTTVSASRSSLSNQPTKSGEKVRGNHHESTFSSETVENGASHTTSKSSGSAKPPLAQSTSRKDSAPSMMTSTTTSSRSRTYVAAGQGHRTLPTKPDRESPTGKEANPNFTIRRNQEHIKDEIEKLDTLRKALENRLKLTLPEDILGALQDGVILCHLVNHIRPRSVVSIHVPSPTVAASGTVPPGTQPAMPKLTPAKSRRNVENFLDACRRLGVSDVILCAAADILEGKNPGRIVDCVQALILLEPVHAAKRPAPAPNAAGARSTGHVTSNTMNPPSRKSHRASAPPVTHSASADGSHGGAKPNQNGGRDVSLV